MRITEGVACIHYAPSPMHSEMIIMHALCTRTQLRNASRLSRTLSYPGYILANRIYCQSCPPYVTFRNATLQVGP